MTEIRIASAAVKIEPSALDDTDDPAWAGVTEHEIVMTVEAAGRTSKFVTCESDEHEAVIRVERGRMRSATGPGLDGLADDATALQIAAWLETIATELDAPITPVIQTLADRIHRMEWRK